MAHVLRDKKQVQPPVQQRPAKPNQTSETRANPTATAAPESAQQVLQLQQALGNRAVQRLIGHAKPTAAIGPEGGPVDAQVQEGIDQARGRGQAVDPGVSAQVGQTLGADLSRVRVHTDARADTLNRSLTAQAFTTGSDIFFSQGTYDPGSASGRELLGHELTHVVQQGAANGAGKSNSVQTKLRVGPASDRYEQEAEQTASHLGGGQMTAQRAGAASPTIQRLFGKKKKQAKPDKANETFEETGTAPNSAIFIVKAAVKTGTKTRGAMSWSDLLGGGSGHSWLSLSLGPAFADVNALHDNAEDGDIITGVMDGATRAELDGSRESTIGFYPNATRPTRKKQMAKQLFADLPGKIIEPEQASFKGQERGSKGYAVTDSTQAVMLLNFINAHRNHPYNVFKYNCTDFVVKALQQLGYSLGNTSNAAGITTPALVYKHIYLKSELGDKTASTTALTNKRNAQGKTYDAKHVNKKTQKKLNKEKAKRAPLEAAKAKAMLESRVVAKYTAPDFIGMDKGMMRPGSEFGVTGKIQGDFGEVVMGGAIGWVHLMSFEQKMGHPYPGAEPSVDDPTEESQDMPIPDEQVNDVMNNVEEVEPNPQADAPEQQDLREPEPTPQPQDQGPQLPPSRTVLTLKADVTVLDKMQPPGEHVIPAGTTIQVLDPREGRIEFDSTQRFYGRVTANIADFLAAI